jgi:hypothetical protein
MTPEAPPPDRNSWMPRSRTNRITLAFAVLGILAVLATATVVLRVFGVIKQDIFQLLTDSDEAPIRVRNGSLDLTILGAQGWEQVGTSGNWRIMNASRHREEFEVTIAVRAGATCGGARTATGPDVVLTYENDNNESTANTSRIVLQSAGRRTLVRPDTGVTMTWDAKAPELLRYQVSGGYLKSIAVGSGSNPAVICTFTAATQLDHLIVLNVP